MNPKKTKRKATYIGIIGGAFIGLILGYFRHLMVMSIHHTEPDNVLKRKALIAAIFIIPAVWLMVVGREKDNSVKEEKDI